jgi:hypothetical protein
MPAPPPELVPFRTAGGTLHTNGFTKTETLHRETGTWLGTTSSGIRLNATYRYDIELRSKGWNILIDDARHVAFVVAPPFRPQLPVAVASGSVEEWMQSQNEGKTKMKPVSSFRSGPARSRLAGRFFRHTRQRRHIFGALKTSLMCVSEVAPYWPAHSYSHTNIRLELRSSPRCEGAKRWICTFQASRGFCTCCGLEDASV